MVSVREQINDTITIGNGKPIAKEFETSDKEIVDYFNDIEQEERKEKFEMILRAGVTALKTVGITEKIDYIQKEFESLNKQFTDTLGDTIDELDNKYEDIFGEKGKFEEIIV